MFADIAINTNAVEAEISRCDARSCRFSIDRKRRIDDFAAAGAMINNLIVCRIAERDLRIAQNKACHKLRNGCCFRCRGFDKLQPCRRVEKEVFCDRRCAFG